MFFRMVYKSGQILLPFCHNPRVWQTDRQTDGQTEISSLYCVCITHSAVIMVQNRVYERAQRDTIYINTVRNTIHNESNLREKIHIIINSIYQKNSETSQKLYVSW